VGVVVFEQSNLTMEARVANDKKDEPCLHCALGETIAILLWGDDATYDQSLTNQDRAKAIIALEALGKVAGDILHAHKMGQTGFHVLCDTAAGRHNDLSSAARHEKMSNSPITEADGRLTDKERGSLSATPSPSDRFH
jgi:hypothetical protein